MLRRPAKESLFSCHFRQNYGQSVSLVNVIFFPNHFEFVFRRQPPFSRKQIGHFLYFKLFRHRSSFVALFNPFNSGNGSQVEGLSFGQSFFEKNLPRPGRLAFPSGANHASSCLFAEANRKENVKTLPPKLHIQTVIFQRGDPIANRPTQKCQEQEDQKARLSASFFWQNRLLLTRFFDFSFFIALIFSVFLETYRQMEERMTEFEMESTFFQQTSFSIFLNPIIVFPCFCQ